MSEFFINRPIFAWVLAIGVMLAGLLSILQLPIAQFPDVAPPQVIVSATYPGASAQVLESSVTQVIEQQLAGLDHLLYFQSQSNAAGTVSVTLTFQAGTNPDTAQVQTQNVVQQANSRLPAQVQQQGLTVTKANSDFLILVGVTDTSDRTDATDVGDWIVSNLQYPLARLNGIGQATLLGSGYAMRIWLNPYKLAAVQLMPSDIAAAIQAQNVDLSAGQVGAYPLAQGADLNAIVTAKSRLSTPEQFRAIVVKTQPNGAVVRLSDVARVEMGAESYTRRTRYDGHPAAALALQLAPGADALKTAEAVKALVGKATSSLPPGYQIFYARDSTDFIKLSVQEVVKTLIEAVVLVVLVMLVFLQDWRTTLIPAIAVPVVLLGTFGVLALAGYSINTLTLFGMVLAIGLLVDDAIVVVENVERIMREEKLPPKEATSKSMKELGSALVGIAMVLSAVLLPMAFFGGSTGVIYRQFSITIVSAMALSVLVALILTPALCATILKPREDTSESKGLGARFNRWFGRNTDRYVHGVQDVIHHRGVFLLVFAAIVVALVVLFVRLPTSYIPNEDQGQSFVIVSLPPGAVQSRTDAIETQIQNHYLHDERKDVAGIYMVSGFSFAGAGPNSGLGFAVLAPFDKRTKADVSVDAINARATKAFAKFRDAQVTPLSPPAVNGLGRSNGFTFELMNTANMDRAEFAKRRDQLLALASKDSKITGVRLNTIADAPQLKVTTDDAKLAVFGLTQNDVQQTLSAAWGGQYVNDFFDRGQVKRVYIQGDAPYRMLPEDLGGWYVRANGGGASSSNSAASSGGTRTTSAVSPPTNTGAAPPATVLASGAGGVAVPSGSSAILGAGSANAFVPTTTATMVPLSAVANTSWTVGASQLTRFQGNPSYEFQGTPAPGVSSGQAMQDMIDFQKKLAPGTGYAFSELSYQEQISSGQGPILFGISALVVFLCLAALYESWSIPFAVLLVIPLGLIGAVLFVTLRGLENNIYFQVGLLTTMGLAAKNAILIVEFAEDQHRSGKTALEAAVTAAKLRLRPILMTSIAFVAGTFPLAIASGAGANSRIAIGTAVVGGMLSATVLAVFFVPMFFVAVSKLFKLDKAHTERSGISAPEPRPA